MTILEIIDAFIIEFPFAAIVFALLLLGGVVWLRQRSGKGPVIYLGVLCLAEFFLVLFAIGGLRELLEPESIGEFIRIAAFTVTAFLGTIAAIGSLTSRASAEKSPPPNDVC